MAATHGALLALWLLAGWPWGRPAPDPHDDVIASWGIPMFLGTIPMLSLGAAGGWLVERVRKVALGMTVAATIGAAVLMAGSIFLSGELFFCNPCAPATAQESIAAGAAGQLLLLLYWGGWVAAAAVSERRERR